MQKIIKTICLALVLSAGLLGAPLLANASVSAQVSTEQLASTTSEIQNGVNRASSGGNPGLESSIQNIINVLLYIVGVVAVIMIIVSGLRYIVSGGDSNAASSAKNGILYSVIGLVIAILAFGIVNFVIDAL